MVGPAAFCFAGAVDDGDAVTSDKGIDAEGKTLFKALKTEATSVEAVPTLFPPTDIELYEQLVR